MNLIILAVTCYCAGPVSLQPTAIARVTFIECVHPNEPDGDETYYEEDGSPSKQWELELGNTENLKTPADPKGGEIFSAMRGEVHFSLGEDDTDHIDPDDNLGEVTLLFDSGKFTGITKETSVTKEDKGTNGGLHTIVLSFSGEGSSYRVTIEIEEEVAGRNVCVLLTQLEGSWQHTANEPVGDAYDELRIFCVRQGVVAGKPGTSSQTWKPDKFGFYHLLPGLAWIGFDDNSIDAPMIGHGTITETQQIRIHADLKEVDDVAPFVESPGWFNVELKLVTTPSGYDVEHKWLAGRDVEFREGASTTPATELTLMGVGQRAGIRVMGSGVRYHFLGTIYVGNTKECGD